MKNHHSPSFLWIAFFISFFSNFPAVANDKQPIGEIATKCITDATKEGDSEETRSLINAVCIQFETLNLEVTKINQKLNEISPQFDKEYAKEINLVVIPSADDFHGWVRNAVKKFPTKEGDWCEAAVRSITVTGDQEMLGKYSLDKNPVACNLQYIKKMQLSNGCTEYKQPALLTPELYAAVEIYADEINGVNLLEEIYRDMRQKSLAESNQEEEAIRRNQFCSLLSEKRQGWLPFERISRDWKRGIPAYLKGVQEKSSKDMEGRFPLLVHANKLLAELNTAAGYSKKLGEEYKLKIEISRMASGAGFEGSEQYLAAKKNGFTTKQQADLYSILNPSDPNAVLRLDAKGITTPSLMNGLISRMKANGYSVVGDDVEAYLDDELEGKRQGISAVKVRDNRRKIEAAAERKRLEEESRKLAAHQKAYPYQITVSCGFNGKHVGIFPCFSDTDFELKNGESYDLYQVRNIKTLGSENTDGLVFDLAPSFKLTAQNSHKTFVLGVKIVERVSGKIVFEKKVSQFGVINVRN